VFLLRLLDKLFYEHSSEGFYEGDAAAAAVTFGEFLRLIEGAEKRRKRYV
jgi:hypothetical protein